MASADGRRLRAGVATPSSTVEPVSTPARPLSEASGDGRYRRESGPPRPAGAASRTGRCAAARARRVASSARATAPDARRAWWAPARGFRRRYRVDVAQASRAFEVSSRYSDSGVVIRMSAARAGTRALARRACRRCARRRAGRGKASPRRVRNVRDPGQRRAQVALDVVGQRLERRDVEHAAARACSAAGREHQAVERRGSGQGLAAAGRREDQRRSPRAMAGHPSAAGGRLRRTSREPLLAPLARSRRGRRREWVGVGPRSRSYLWPPSGGEQPNGLTPGVN